MSDRGGFPALLRGFWRPEIARTCKECGYSWKAPRYFTKRHARAAPPISGQGGTTARSVGMSNEALLGEEATFNLCAKCGSKKFSQKRIWFESKADFEDQ